MFSSILPIKKILQPVFIALSVFFAAFVFVSETPAKVVVVKSGNLGVIKGIVRDNSGSPIADATVAIFRLGTSNLLKQVRSASDGSFLAKIIPGTYTVLAVAEGFNPITLSEVEVNGSAELVYKFKLERSGSGNTLPEKRADRSNSKWTIRAAQSRRSIYQNKEGDASVDESKIDEDSIAENPVEENIGVADDEDKTKRSGQTVVETYFANSGDGIYTGLNFARLQPLNENAEIVFAGQIGTSKSAPKRFEANFKFRPNENHQIRLNGAVAKFGKAEIDEQEKSLGQFSFQALDEWKVRSDVILVFGFDYSKFFGAGNDFSISPRVGLQYDVNSKTRFRTAYTTQNEERTWQHAIELEDTQVLFREPVAVQDFVVEDNKPRMNKSSRLEFGIERILDNKSNIETNIFFDTTAGRGVGLTNIPFDALNDNTFSEFVGNQQGRAQGIRVVYTRRLNGNFSTSAGYSFGNGQKLSEKAISNPADIFENDFFQTFIGQFDADFKTGTQVKTIFRLSPQATVFAIDPFEGRMAIYDPGLSILVTQSLPNWGLPIRAEAIVDARNLFDFQTNVSGKEGSLRLNSQQRVLRGGILVRF
ncbi:MAG: carboxypeptidase regulatory-like domain-containing protein [Acidobacteria bacterium]|nr:carboxypeptidase regulatory-like domain-containing protein [Acidobacteriota bacterium]